MTFLWLPWSLVSRSLWPFSWSRSSTSLSWIIKILPPLFREERQQGPVMICRSSGQATVSSTMMMFIMMIMMIWSWWWSWWRSWSSSSAPVQDNAQQLHNNKKKFDCDYVCFHLVIVYVVDLNVVFKTLLPPLGRKIRPREQFDRIFSYLLYFFEKPTHRLSKGQKHLNWPSCCSLALWSGRKQFEPENISLYTRVLSNH